jgi:predicted NBD/HSP70 family sugar kinase
MVSVNPATPGEILRLIRNGAAATRREISEATGLSRMTVSQRLDALRSAGLIQQAGRDESTGGRRPARLTVNVDHGLVLIAVADTTRVELMVSDLGGGAVAEIHRDVDLRDGAAVVLDEVLGGFRALLRNAECPPDRVAGVGLSLPGPVDPHTSRPSQPPLMPGWDGYDIVGHIQNEFEVPVVVENDANAIALGEWASHHADASTLCLIKVGAGIGCGIVVHGALLAGADGGSGDIGHVRLDGHDDALCTCGSRGCLGAIASGWAVAARLGAAGRGSGSVSEVRRLVEEADTDALREVRSSGRLIGRVASMVNSVLNPDVLVVTGELATSALLAGMQESLYEFSLPRAVRHLQVTLGGLGDRAARHGLVRLVADQVFAPDRVDRLVGLEG